MAYEISLSKKTDKTGRAELLIRMRLGKIAQRAKTGLRVFTKHVREESYISIKGRSSTRLVITVPRSKTPEAYHTEEVKKQLEELIAFIDLRANERDKNKIGDGWLAKAVQSFFSKKQPTPQSKTAKAKKEPSIFEYFDRFLENKPQTPGTYRQYMVFYRIFQRFEMYKQVVDPEFHITFSNIDVNLLNELDHYMKHEFKLLKKFPKILKAVPESRMPGERGQNTVNGYFKKLRAFVMWAIDQELMDKSPFRKFKISKEVYGTPYMLTHDELYQLRDTDLSRRPALAVQRDIFLFHCCIGCRVSDLKTMTRANVINGEVHYIARKTSTGHPLTLKIPLNKMATAILERYADEDRKALLPFISDQKYNEAIKEIMTIAGITRNVVIRNSLTGEQEIRPINEIASSHMARRTFTHIIYKTCIDHALVSELTGHTPKSAAFARYREVDQELKRDMVSALD